jgi:virginiamycin B lyase
VTGTVTEYVIAPNSGPNGITAGPDGAMWFGTLYSNTIGRITMDGVSTSYPVPTPGRMGGIALGADGNLWFAEADANKIGRIIGR